MMVYTKLIVLLILYIVASLYSYNLGRIHKALAIKKRSADLIGSIIELVHAGRIGVEGAQDTETAISHLRAIEATLTELAGELEETK